MIDTTMWKSWNTTPPEPGMKVCVVADDGCGAMLGLVVSRSDGGIDLLDAENGMELYYQPFLKGAIWSELPNDYGDLMFMDTDLRDY